MTFQIHPINERDPVPLAIHHYPVCSTFAFFNLVFKFLQTSIKFTSKFKPAGGAPL
jgi:hypothetical protein